MSAYKIEYVEVAIQGVKLVREKSVLIVHESGEEVFIPRVALSKQDDDDLDDEGTGFSRSKLQVAKWFCQEKGLI